MFADADVQRKVAANRLLNRPKGNVVPVGETRVWVAKDRTIVPPAEISLCGQFLC